MTPTQLAALRNELQTDPLTYGYAASVAAGGDGDLANQLNKLRDGTDGEAAITVPRTSIDASEIVECVVLSEYAALTQANRNYLDALTNCRSVRLINPAGVDTRIKASLLGVFGVGTGTRTNLGAIQSQTGSRAEQLFGTGTVVSHEDVAQALRG